MVFTILIPEERHWDWFVLKARRYCELPLGLIIGSGTYTVHKWLGIGVSVGAGLQFVLAHVARPKPDAPNRASWNMMHWWLGRLTVIAAWVNLLTGHFRDR